MAKKTKPPRCMECGAEAALTAGRAVYPNSPDLWDKVLWVCQTAGCDARCGCHAGTEKPLGRPAGPELRRARVLLHGKLDPVWKGAEAAYTAPPVDNAQRWRMRAKARTRSYAWLADSMGLTSKECHVAKFSIEQCRQAWRLLDGIDYAQIRAWAKAQTGKREGETQ